MTDDPTRFRVVGGTDVKPEPVEKPKKPRKKRPPLKDQLMPVHCAQCSEELGYEYAQMVQVLRNPHEANGKLVEGSLWWACARCLQARYLIKGGRR